MDKDIEMELKEPAEKEVDVGDLGATRGPSMTSKKFVQHSEKTARNMQSGNNIRSH